MRKNNKVLMAMSVLAIASIILAACGAPPTPETIVVGLPPCVSQFRLNQLPIHPGQTRSVLGLDIRAEEGPFGSLRFEIRLAGGALRFPPDASDGARDGGALKEDQDRT